MLFYVGTCEPHHAKHFDRAFLSMNVLRKRKSDPMAKSFIADSGAFSEITRHGRYRHEPEEYAEEVSRVAAWNGFECAVTQDFMCEPFVLNITGMTVRDHQRLTIDRYKRIQANTDAYIMPVLQGYAPREYLNHLDAYGDLLKDGMRVGVGSVCKRNARVADVENVLMAIKQAAPGLLLHGFGVKTTALKSEWVWECLYSADSMAWMFAAWKGGRDLHDWREAIPFVNRIENQCRIKSPRQLALI